MALFSLSPIFLMTLVTHDTHDHIKIIFKKNEKKVCKSFENRNVAVVSLQCKLRIDS